MSSTIIYVYVKLILDVAIAYKMRQYCVNQNAHVYIKL